MPSGACDTRNDANRCRVARSDARHRSGRPRSGPPGAASHRRPRGTSFPPELPLASWPMDVTDETFQTDVLDRSATVPVIVDLWAPWCGPCKTLGPMIEKAVADTGGAVELAKVNVDDNPAGGAGLQRAVHPRRLRAQPGPGRGPVHRRGPRGADHRVRPAAGAGARARRTRWSRRATKPRCARPSSSSPTTPAPPRAWPAF